MRTIRRPRPGRGAVAWAFLLSVCLVYGAFALASGLGLVGQEIERALRPAFYVHALSGGVALIAAGLQASSTLRRAFPMVHRTVGRAYVGAVVLASTSGTANAIAFRAGPAAKVSLCLLCGIWLFATLAGHREIRRGRLSGHRAWMIRSLSLSLFFVTFTLWVPAFARTGLPHELGYTLAVTLSWSLNLLAAEIIVRKL